MNYRRGFDDAVVGRIVLAQWGVGRAIPVRTGLALPSSLFQRNFGRVQGLTSPHFHQHDTRLFLFALRHNSHQIDFRRPKVMVAHLRSV